MQYLAMRLVRRTLLIWTAGLLAGGNLLVVLPAALPRGRDWVTYAGLGSLAYMIPVGRAASAYEEHRWKPGLDATRFASEPVDYVTLTPEPTFGHFVQVIRDLKKRHRCNVLIHYPGIRTVTSGSAGFERAFEIPVLMLCGEPLADANIPGPVLEDGFVTG